MIDNVFIRTATCFVLGGCFLVSSVRGESNSKGPNSSVVVGTLKSVDPSGTKLKVLQEGDLLRKLHSDSSTRVYFVGISTMAERKATVGYGVKASCEKDGRIKTISFTLPVGEPKPLGEKRLSMTVAELFKRIDGDESSTVSYIEFSKYIYHSPKHGPDSFRKADGDSDGVLSPDEFRKALVKVSWWKLSRRTPDEWFIQADSNRDRKLDVKEFSQICTSGNHIENIFKRTDRDTSGQLSLRETVVYIRSVTHGVKRTKKKPGRDE
jgi:Ca2+-binding EF-hand superfamily protein